MKMATSSPLCQLNGGCMGCCGHDFISKQKIKAAIDENTKEFTQLQPDTEEKFITFRDRRHPMDLRDGVCRNLIEEKGRFLCSLHPARHQGKDLRIGHCDTNYLCKTAREFDTWNADQRQTFLNFVNVQQLDNITYSIKMDDNSLLAEFLKSGKISSISKC